MSADEFQEVKEKDGFKPPVGYNNEAEIKRGEFSAPGVQKLNGDGKPPLVELLDDGRTWLVIFVSRECRHCYRALYSISQVSQSEDAIEAGIQFGFVDCGNPLNNVECVAWHATRLPGIALLEHSTKSIYIFPKNQPRTPENLAKFILEGEQMGTRPVPWLWGPTGPIAKMRLRGYQYAALTLAYALRKRYLVKLLQGTTKNS